MSHPKINRMDGTPPPTHHVLRPHHIGVLAIFILTYKEYESKPLPPPFVLHTIRLLLHEVSEACFLFNSLIFPVRNRGVDSEYVGDATEDFPRTGPRFERWAKG